MFLQIIGDSLTREPRRKVITAAALALGMAVATATLTVALDVGDRLAREFRSFGANLLVTPQADTLPLEIGGVDYRPVGEGAYLAEKDLGRLKMIFWRHNIVGFSPFLEVPVSAQSAGFAAPLGVTLIGTWYQHPVLVPDGTTFVTGVNATHPWWHVDGRWFADGAEECVVGADLARRADLKAGATLELEADAQHRSVRVTGILSTGGPEEQGVVAPLNVAQALAGEPGQFRRMMVSALTKPEDAFSRRDPHTMTPEEYERWDCSPYISSIAHQIQDALPGVDVQPIRRVAESEGRILTRVSGLMWVVTIAALIAAALAVGATSATTVFERRAEVGLMKALGAGNWRIGSFFLAEQLLLAIVGGGIGYVLGIVLARVLGETVFGAPVGARLLLLPVVLTLAAIVAVAGSLFPLRRAMHLEPAPVLRGE